MHQKSTQINELGSVNSGTTVTQTLARQNPKQMSMVTSNGCAGPIIGWFKDLQLDLQLEPQLNPNLNFNLTELGFKLGSDV